MNRAAKRLFAVLVTSSAWALLAIPAWAQYGSRGSSGPPMGGPGEFLRRMDANNNGVLEPSELSERSRYFIDRAARDAGLDPSRPIPISRLEESMRQRFSGGSSSSGDRSYSGDRSSGGDRSYGSRSYGGDRSSGSQGSSYAPQSSASAAPAVPAAPTGVQGFGVPVQLAVVPGFGDGAAGLGVDSQDLKDARERLDDADRNHDGFVDQEEARREDVGPDYWAYDRNADGKLTLEEIAARYQARRMARMSAKVEQRDMDEAKETIRRYDKNNDGMVDEEELKESRYRDEYRRYDANHDGKISQQEMAQRYAGRRINTAPIPTGRAGTSTAMASLNRSPIAPSSSSRPPTSSSSGSNSTSSSNSSNSRSSSSGTGEVDQRTRDRVDERMNETDKNKDGYIDKQEFEANRSRFRSEMREYDTNGDGRISKDELLKRYASFSGFFGGGSGGPPGGGGFPGGGPPGSGGFPGGSFGSRDGGSRDGGSRDWGSRDSGSRGGSSSRSASSAPTKSSYRFLTPTERLDKNLPEWFAQKDKNGDGQVAMAEFSGSWSESEANDFLRADLDGDGVITAKECLLGPAVSVPDRTGGAPTQPAKSSATLASAQGTTEEKYVRYGQQMVAKYDTNKDKVLDAAELKSFSRAPEKSDADGDGKVTVEELSAALQAASKK